MGRQAEDADKRHRVRARLQSVEGARLSDRSIAKLEHCSQPFVSKLRKKHALSAERGDTEATTTSAGGVIGQPIGPPESPVAEIAEPLSPCVPLGESDPSAGTDSAEWHHAWVEGAREQHRRVVAQRAEGQDAMVSTGRTISPAEMARREKPERERVTTGQQLLDRMHDDKMGGKWRRVSWPASEIGGIISEWDPFNPRRP